MYTPSCPSQPLPLRQPRFHNMKLWRLDPHPNGSQPRRNKGQVLVVFAISLLALLFFIGLALDAGMVYVTYGQLKRAIDAGSVAAANNFKRGGTNDQMYAAVLETLKLQNMNINPADLELVVTTCDMDGDGWQDNNPSHPGPNPLPAEFAALCPDTDPIHNTVSARKLVYVEAKQRTPLYFLSLLGIRTVNLTTSSVAEAASIDLVLVIDTSESMANKTPGFNTDFDPSTCFPGAANDNHCYPLRDAIDAAAKLDSRMVAGEKTLIDTLYSGYDNVAVVTYDTIAHVPLSLTPLTNSNRAGIKDTINKINVHDDAPQQLSGFGVPRMWSTWAKTPSDATPPDVQTLQSGLINPTNMEDRDGDGQDLDASKPCWFDPATHLPLSIDKIDVYDLNAHWDSVNHVPCDLDTSFTTAPGASLGAYKTNSGAPGVNDAYNWTRWQDFTDPPITSDINTAVAAIHAAGAGWLDNSNNSKSHGGNGRFSAVSTCTGCAIRVATNELRAHGRPGAVWVIVLLSDGGVNMSDTPDMVNSATVKIVPDNYPNGFCTQYFWKFVCFDGRPAPDPANNHLLAPYRPRFCVDKTVAPLTNGQSCPPYSTWVNTITYDIGDVTHDTYSPFDYALDMTDEAALRINTSPTNDPRYNPKEPLGNDIALYTIGLGDDPSMADVGVPLLRYMAAVGDDGDRFTDECKNSLNQVLAIDKNCGQYYYARTGAQLGPIFDSIASRIYTKITH
jgi:hypothetical protein